MDGSQTRLSIVIPVYNEEECLPLLLEKLDHFSQDNPEIKCEIIFVDDHSTDRSQEILRHACESKEDYCYLRFSANRGSHTAVLAGLEHARGECAVFLAADLQDPPELIPRMLDLWRQDNRVVWAVREQRDGVSFVDALLANTFYAVLNRIGEVRIAPRGSDFVLMDRVVVDGLKATAGSRVFLMTEIASIGFTQTEIKYVKEARVLGASKWTLRKKVSTSFDAFCSFSFLPLRISTVMGLTISLISVLYGMVVIIRALLGYAPVEGWSSLMVVLLFMGGAQMVMLGIMGEYVLRILEECRPRLRYHLENSLGFEPAAKE